MSTDSLPAEPKDTAYREIEPATAAQQSTAPTNINTSSRHLHKWYIAPIILIIVGILIGLVLWIFIRQPITKSSSGVTEMESTSKGSDKHQASLNANPAAGSAYDFVKSFERIVGVKSSVDETYSSGSKKLDIYDFAVPIDKEKSSRITFYAANNEELADVEKTIKSFFESDDFQYIEETDDFPIARYYLSSDYVCEHMSIQASPFAERRANYVTPYLSIICARTVDYKESADKLASFYTQIVNNKKYQLSIISMQSPNFIDSDTKGYKTFQAAQITTQDELTTFTAESSRIARFYQTPDEQWHMIKSFDAKLSCDDVDSNKDIQKAFAGQTCTTSNDKQIKIEG